MEMRLKIHKQCTLYPLFFGLTFLISSVSFATESLTHLAKRIKLNEINAGIEKGDRNAFTTLPAKGYKNGISDILKKYNVYVNPAYSFTSYGSTDKFTQNGFGPGCVISLKLARKLPNVSYQDNGIRIEYAISPGERKYVPNNSAYARNAISGNGFLEAQLDK